METLPKLIIHPDGSSGVEIHALLGKKYGCVEYTLRDDVPQKIFVAPWHQFMPAELSADILALGVEIIRRANAYEALVKQAARDNKNLDDHRDAIAEANADVTYFACALAEITSKITDPVLKAEAAAYRRTHHKQDLERSTHRQRPPQTLEDHEAQRKYVEEVLSQNDYTAPPHPDLRASVLGIK